MIIIMKIIFHRPKYSNPVCPSFRFLLYWKFMLYCLESYFGSYRSANSTHDFPFTDDGVQYGICCGQVSCGDHHMAGKNGISV